MKARFLVSGSHQYQCQIHANLDFFGLHTALTAGAESAGRVVAEAVATAMVAMVQWTAWLTRNPIQVLVAAIAQRTIHLQKNNHRERYHK